MKWFQKPQEDGRQSEATYQTYAATVLAAARLLASLRRTSPRSGSLLERECSRSQELGHPLTLLQLELADWPRVLQSLGEDRASQTLEELELVLHGTLRNTDILLTETKGSFTILLPGTTAQDAPTVMRNLRQAIHGYRILAPDGTAFFLRLHPWIGSASLPEDGSSAEALNQVLHQRLEAQKHLPTPLPDEAPTEKTPPLRLVA
ncbi:diguanylate cyclase [Armatimonas sp.]|uniref:diguanylate cyclase domain-containing protein n=1 Tax=Armatimonas sp. TaxID=1872638 RepID=UPI00286BEE5B|nr:diguanylate cyclase [Armatimonas sp.]